MPELLTVAEAAALLRYSPQTILLLCQKGQLPARKIGREWRISATALREMMPAARSLESDDHAAVR